MTAATEVIWQSERNFKWTAHVGPKPVVPCILTLRKDGLTITRWYPIFYMLSGFGLILLLLRFLTNPREIQISSDKISGIHITKRKGITNPIPGSVRYKSDRPLVYQIVVALADRTEYTILVPLRKETLDRFQNVEWLHKVITGP